MDETSTFVASFRSWTPAAAGRRPQLDAGRSWTPEWLIAIRLGLARLLGRHDAGIRTHILVAMGSCVFTLVSWELNQHIRAIEQPATGDPIRIIAAVTAGAGFLAAGIIFQSGSKMHGLTTQAGVWTAAAIGVAYGTGAYAIAVITTAIVLVVLSGMQLLRQKLGWYESGPPVDRVKTPGPDADTQPPIWLAQLAAPPYSG